MEIRHLETFLSVAKLLSFNRAAEKLHYAQSSISAQIQSLEKDLGVQLFDRLGRGIRLTEAGDRLLQYAEKITDLAEETRSEIGSIKAPRGSLTIRIPETLGVYRLPPVITRFRSAFPNVQLRFTTCTHDGLQKDLRKGITDLAFLLTESIHAADMEVETLGFESIVMVSSPAHPFASRKRVRTSDLEGETVLLSRVDCSYRKIFENILEKEGVGFDTSMIFHSVEALKRCVMENAGITILPHVSVADDVSRGKLVPLKWEEGTIEAALLMIWYKERWVSPSLEAFMEMAREYLKESYSQSPP